MFPKLYNLDDGGKLALGIQGAHTNSQKEIKDEIFSEQKII
ncbi:MAG: hypothetical protein O4861_13040 [Trichodesmium sp. St16_bin4-tuft]|nr:hypothetical protein [Trichodesmium sp. St16_bin4-tuft]